MKIHVSICPPCGVLVFPVPSFVIFFTFLPRFYRIPKWLWSRYLFRSIYSGDFKWLEQFTHFSVAFTFRIHTRGGETLNRSLFIVSTMTICFYMKFGLFFVQFYRYQLIFYEESEFVYSFRRLTSHFSICSIVKPCCFVLLLCDPSLSIILIYFRRFLLYIQRLVNNIHGYYHWSVLLIIFKNLTLGTVKIICSNF